MGLQTLSALCKVYLDCNFEMLTMNECYAKHQNNIHESLTVSRNTFGNVSKCDKCDI